VAIRPVVQTLSSLRTPGDNLMDQWVLGEFGDDPNRYTDAKSRRKLRRHLTIDRCLRQETRATGPPFNLSEVLIGALTCGFRNYILTV